MAAAVEMNADLPFLLAPAYARATASLNCPALPLCPLRFMFPNYTDNAAVEAQLVRGEPDPARTARVLFQGEDVPPPVYWSVARERAALLRSSASSTRPLQEVVAAPAGSSSPPKTPSARENRPPHRQDIETIEKDDDDRDPTLGTGAASSSPADGRSPDAADYRSRLYREGRAQVARMRAAAAADSNTATTKSNKSNDGFASVPIRLNLAGDDETSRGSTSPAALSPSKTAPTTVKLSPIANGATTALINGGGLIGAGSSSSKYCHRAEQEMVQHLTKQLAAERERADSATERCAIAEAAATLAKGRQGELEDEVRLLRSELSRARVESRNTIEKAMQFDREKRQVEEALAVMQRDLDEANERNRSVFSSVTAQQARKLEEQLVAIKAELATARATSDSLYSRLGEAGVQLAAEKKESRRIKEEYAREKQRLDEEVSMLRDRYKQAVARAESLARDMAANDRRMSGIMQQIKEQYVDARSMLLMRVAEDESSARRRWEERERVVRAQAAALEASSRFF